MITRWLSVYCSPRHSGKYQVDEVGKQGQTFLFKAFDGLFYALLLPAAPVLVMMTQKSMVFSRPNSS